MMKLVLCVNGYQSGYLSFINTLYFARTAHIFSIHVGLLIYLLISVLNNFINFAFIRVVHLLPQNMAETKSFLIERIAIIIIKHNRSSREQKKHDLSIEVY